MMGLLITLLFVIIIFGLVWWAISQIPLPPPVVVIARVALVVILLILLLEVMSGLPGINWHPMLR